VAWQAAVLVGDFETILEPRLCASPL